MTDKVQINKERTISDIAQAGYDALKGVGEARSFIMEQVKKAAAGSGTDGAAKIYLASKDGSPVGSQIDISTGAGALVLDDALQELSTIEQAAAQLVAAENKAQKQVHSVTGQG